MGSEVPKLYIEVKDLVIINKLKKQEIQQYLKEEDKRANLIEYLQRSSSEKFISKKRKKNIVL